MAKVILSSFLISIRGRVGDLVFRHRNGCTFVSPRPIPGSLPPTDAQLTQRQHFSFGIARARALLADPEKRARYEAIAVARKKAVFNLVVSDVLRSPEILQIDGAMLPWPDDDIITIRVRDVAVERVEVIMTLEDGKEFAAGLAAPNGEWWTFKCGQPIPWEKMDTVDVTAVDLAGNESRKVYCEKMREK